MKAGFIREVMKGWYASFWALCADYLIDRFGQDRCLSPKQPRYRSPKAGSER